ncbi:hypothetical protein VTH06DRAFT_5049 [Thermothelomyces fergusii]
MATWQRLCCSDQATRLFGAVESGDGTTPDACQHNVLNNNKQALVKTPRKQRPPCSMNARLCSNPWLKHGRTNIHRCHQSQTSNTKIRFRNIPDDQAQVKKRKE